ncbi:hypothetical protein QTP86_002084 [Hemibagrus guttatus]|nr:hypothetical protein QTP86_002084 [Hemibagrus guttatus]
MDVEDEQCDELLGLIEKQEQFADHLMDLATKLEEMTKTMTKVQVLGNTATVVGSVALVGVGIATYFTVVLAPLLVKTVGVVASLGTATSLTCTILELWKSNEAMKNAEKTSNEIKEIWKKVGESQDLKGLPSDEVGSKITATILKAVVKTTMKKAAKKGTKFAVKKGVKYAAANGVKSASLLVTNEGTSVALKTMLKGTGKVAGGAFGLVFTLPDMIENCEKLYKDKHETDASSYLRKTANEIRDAVKQLKKRLNELEKMYDETSDTE